MIYKIQYFFNVHIVAYKWSIIEQCDGWFGSWPDNNCWVGRDLDTVGGFCVFTLGLNLTFLNFIYLLFLRIMDLFGTNLEE